MNKKFFYSKLAIGNIKKNGQFYFSYLIIGIFIIAMFYVMSFIAYDKALDTMPGASNLRMMLGLGVWVISVMGGIFLFYTNGFLIRRRKRELGLYNILGMEKKHVALVMLVETFLLAVFSIVGGILTGILFSKLVMMSLVKLLDFPIPVVFSVSIKAVQSSGIFFTAVFICILFSNIWAVKKAKPIELLSAGNVGEKEPKSRLLVTLAGLAALGSAYYISLSIESPLAAIQMFFVAVLLVILGTYLLFTAGSITVLKILRKNKKFYYQTNHFASVSGMIYRMKQNAKGLSNICILCTMVLVTVSTTVCMYLGTDDAVEQRYPHDIMIRAKHLSGDALDKEGILNTVRNTVKGQGLSLKRLEYYDSASILGQYKDREYQTQDLSEAMGTGGIDFSWMHTVSFLTQQDYESLTGEKLHLSENETAVYDSAEKTDDEYRILGEDYIVTKRLTISPFSDSETSFGTNDHLIVLADEAALGRICEEDARVTGVDGGIDYMIEMDIAADADAIIECYQKMHEDLAAYDTGNLYWECQEDSRSGFYTDFGGFLFIGIFLGILFLMITVLIIYYKQISEGYDDRKRFEIMQKVGMSRREVRKTIHTQILMVFMLPILAAILHLMFAFPIVVKLLAIFNLTNVKLFVACIIGTCLIFTLIYVLVYAMTSKTYYKIVEE